jgi:hypothetical protein
VLDLTRTKEKKRPLKPKKILKEREKRGNVGAETPDPGKPVQEREGGRKKGGWIRVKSEYKSRGNSLSNTLIFFFCLHSFIH